MPECPGPRKPSTVGLCFHFTCLSNFAKQASNLAPVTIELAQPGQSRNLKADGGCCHFSLANPTNQAIPSTREKGGKKEEEKRRHRKGCRNQKAAGPVLSTRSGIIELNQASTLQIIRMARCRGPRGEWANSFMVSGPNGPTNIRGRY